MALKEKTLAEHKIMSIRTPPTINTNEDLEWVCRSFGFLESRDKRKMACNIFKALVEAAKLNEGLSSDELSEKLASTRGTIVHHQKRMMKSGLVIYHEGQ
jgi:hypothetical protein